MPGKCLKMLMNRYDVLAEFNIINKISKNIKSYPQARLKAQDNYKFN